MKEELKQYSIDLKCPEKTLYDILNFIAKYNIDLEVYSSPTFSEPYIQDGQECVAVAGVLEAEMKHEKCLLRKIHDTTFIMNCQALDCVHHHFINSVFDCGLKYVRVNKKGICSHYKKKEEK